MAAVRVERPSVCPLDCPDTCSLTVTVEDDRIVAIRGSHANPYTGGVLCAKRSEEHTSELQSQSNLVCRLLLEKKKKQKKTTLLPKPKTHSDEDATEHRRRSTRCSDK